MDYGGLRRSELFTFFHLSESSRSAPSDEGIVRVFLKPGGFREFVDIEVQIDQSSLVRSASLFMDRNWVGDVTTVNPFAKDITKTFITVLVHPEDSPSVKDVVAAIWNLRGTRDRVYYLTQPPEEEDYYDPETLRAQRVYLGEEDKLEMIMPSSELIMENSHIQGKDLLRLTISSF